MISSNDLAYLLDIVENARLAQKFTVGMSQESYQSDLKTHYAVIQCIEIMGEAAKHVSETFKQQYADIRWKDMAGMRDVLIHNYNNVQIAEVWRSIQEDVPHLLARLEPLIPPADKSES